MLKYSNVQLSTYSNVQMLKCSNVHIFKCSNVSMFKCSHIQMFQCFNVPMFQWSNIYIIGIIGIQCSNVQMFRCSNVQKFKCANVLMSNVTCQMSNVNTYVQLLSEHTSEVTPGIFDKVVLILILCFLNWQRRDHSKMMWLYHGSMYHVPLYMKVSSLKICDWLMPCNTM